MKNKVIRLFSVQTLSAIVIAALCVSCVRPSQKAAEKKSTNELIAFLSKYKDVNVDAKNDVQKDEIFQNREDSLVLLQDSLGVFSNIEGKIQNIHFNDFQDTKVLEFNVVIEPEQYFKITLECAHIVHKDSIASDSLYNKIKNLSEFATVYVDGAVGITDKIKPANSGWSFDKDTQFSYPEYKFNVIALSERPLPAVSNELRHAIVLWRKGFEAILKDGKGKETDEKINTFKKASQNLSPSDDAYMGRYVHACSGDLYRE